MSERLSDIEKFWNNFKEEFIQWNNGLTNHPMTTSSSATSTLMTSTTSASITTTANITVLQDMARPAGGPLLQDLVNQVNNLDNIGQTCTFNLKSNHHTQDSIEIEFCRHNFDCSFCEKCQPYCDIHMTKPCANYWSPIVEACCGMCDIQCETECPILLYVLTPIFSILGTIRISIKNIIIVSEL